MPTAYIHIGAHKTGTSAFQAFLRYKRDWIEARGLRVPATGQIDAGGHHPLARALTGVPGPLNPQAMLEKFEGEIRSFRGDDLVISSETFARLMRAPVLTDRVCEFFKRCGYEPLVIYYMRHPTGGQNSGYAQRAKTLQETRGIAEFVASKLEDLLRPTPLWRQLIENDRLECRILPYNRSVVEHGITASILPLLGIVEPPPAVYAGKNAIPGPVTVGLGRWMLRRIHETGEFPDLLKKKHLMRAMWKLVEESGIETVRYVGLTSAMAASIDERTAERRAELAERVWGRRYEECYPGEIGRHYACNDFELSHSALPPLDQWRELQRRLIGEWAAIQAMPPAHDAADLPMGLQDAMASIGADPDDRPV